MQNKIKIKGARQHNLKNISLEIPRDKLVVFTGLSGSGKSSLAFDTIFAEGQRRYIESLSAYARQFLGKLDKPDVDEIEGLSPAISIDQKSHSANPRSTVATITEIYDYLRVLFARAGVPHCPDCGEEIRRLTNEEIVDIAIDFAKTGKGKNLVILAPVVQGRKGEHFQLLYDLLNAGFSEARIDREYISLHDRIDIARYKMHTIELVVDRMPGMLDFSSKDSRLRVSEAVENALKYGKGVATIVTDREASFSTKFTCPRDGFSFPEIEPRLFSFNSPFGACETCHGLGTEDLFSDNICKACEGRRLKPEALNVLIDGKNIASVTGFSISEATEFFESFKKKFSLKRQQDAQNILAIAEVPLREIQSRLKFMYDVGLEYLTLNRKAGTLSGGEAQRIRLASQIGSRLVGALYVLDEPTIGLHQRDNAKLINTLLELRDLGNSILVVEHDEDTIRASDYLVDIGPGAGVHGGHVVAAGPMPALLKDTKQHSPTLDYLRGKQMIAVPSERRKLKKDHPFLVAKNININNLKGVTAKIPLKRFVAITGVSGSGKSTLLYDVLYRSLSNKFNYTKYKTAEMSSLSGLENLNRVINIDQSAIGRTPRSNPATYVGAWTYIRDLFASTEEARVRGYKPGRFSFNVKGGRCENCEGHGVIAIEMHFLPTVYVECDVCRGKRFDRETLEVTYGPSTTSGLDRRGKDKNRKNIHEVLKMTVEEAVTFFYDVPWLHDRLKILEEVGLGYLELGQSATTLSGGEAQRIKLSAELGKRDTHRTIYLFDEPTTGLHFADVQKLLDVLNRLVERGNSVVVIEHNLDVIKSADWVIDLGPEGGDKGGKIIAEGTPEQIAKTGKSFTGEYLRRILKT
ncbi:MAG: excinuclease ABC subunit A [Candidatus Harrisonbacteria bacterium CG10_big_fil_rev_8_21_14_0_10_40_38]|uniref:UvrABC system protein A n=1 Tax=Candidatus Harrisonbacteria bacterium CG10_big_fil_rev_8_21_14_0_10_40_38 TaxID=1974583 RepID=A0A2H0USQ0_9BACT|nr:MAG: excinuclease ABC subunit A [Candidatus Harrisonbacteria bacterium CG10_big_fil_rev_8_21_14_0_10_40_38]